MTRFVVFIIIVMIVALYLYQNFALKKKSHGDTPTHLTYHHPAHDQAHPHDFHTQKKEDDGIYNDPKF